MEKNVCSYSNIITALRIILAPLAGLLVVLGTQYHSIALILFLVASATDYLDGHVARTYNTTSKLGAFLDPLADKILVGTLFFAGSDRPIFHFFHCRIYDRDLSLPMY